MQKIGQDPVFIIGNRRSGTTMLRLMLASHPAFGIPPEGGFIVTMGWIWQRKKISKQDFPRMIEAFFIEDNARDWQFSPEQLQVALSVRCPSSFPEFVDEVYRTYLRLKFPGKMRWGDKTTWYLDFIPMIARLFPKARFVHIIRDGRDIACSYRKMDHMPHDIRRIALEWAANIETLRRSWHFLGPRRFLEVHYEDLTADPQAELEKICHFLGEDFVEEMCEFYKRNKEDELEPKRHMGWKGKTTKPVDTSSIGRWKEELSGDELYNFECIAGDTLMRLGYALASPQRTLADRVTGDIMGCIYGTYWRCRQKCRGPKASVKEKLHTILK